MNQSNRNREGKRTARERLREQRDREAQRAKRRRALIAGGAVLVALALAGGIAALVASGGDDGGDGAVGTPSAAPAGATGDNRLVISTGAADAPSTLTVYEDFRCPACGFFEHTFRGTIHELEDSGQLKVDYHLVRIIDGNVSGTGSLNAANAAACAQDERKFRAYHDVLYQNQPEETEDRFASKPYLIQLAGKVGGLRTGTFTRCVNSGKYNDWVEKSNADFANSGHNATPTILLNGTDVYSGTGDPLTPERLKRRVAEANKGKKRGTATPSP